MAFIKCSGGGALKETVLWDNSNGDATGAEATITLNSNINNFDYIKVKWIGRKQDIATATPMYAIMEIESFKLSIDQNYGCQWSITGKSTVTYSRFIRYVNDTSLLYTRAGRISQSELRNDIAYPLMFYGLK